MSEENPKEKEVEAAGRVLAPQIKCSFRSGQLVEVKLHDKMRVGSISHGQLAKEHPEFHDKETVLATFECVGPMPDDCSVLIKKQDQREPHQHRIICKLSDLIRVPGEY